MVCVHDYGRVVDYPATIIEDRDAYLAVGQLVPYQKSGTVERIDKKFIRVQRLMYDFHVVTVAVIAADE